MSRTKGVLKDIGGTLKGEAPVDSRGRPRKKEWEKPWANKLKNAAILGTALAGFKGVKHMAEHPGAMAEARDFFANKGHVAIAKNLMAKMPGPVQRGATKVVEHVKEVKQQAAGGAQDLAGWVMKGLRKAAGQVEQPSHLTHATGAVYPKGHPEYEKLWKARVSTPTRTAAEQAEAAAKKAKSDLTKGAHGDIKYSAIEFQKLSKDEYEDEIDAYQRDTGKEFRRYHLKGQTVRHAALHHVLLYTVQHSPCVEPTVYFTAGHQQLVGSKRGNVKAIPER